MRARTHHLKFIGHILRLPNDEPAKEYALCVPCHSKRKPGQQRTLFPTKYIQCLLGDMYSMLDHGQLTAMANDRCSWRKFVVACSAAEWWWIHHQRLGTPSYLQTKKKKYEWRKPACQVHAPILTSRSLRWESARMSRACTAVTGMCNVIQDTDWWQEPIVLAISRSICLGMSVLYWVSCTGTSSLSSIGDGSQFWIRSICWNALFWRHIASSECCFGGRIHDVTSLSTWYSKSSDAFCQRCVIDTSVSNFN